MFFYKLQHKCVKLPIKYIANKTKQKYTQQIQTQQTRKLHTNTPPPNNSSNIPFVLMGCGFVLYDTYKRNKGK